MELKIGLYNDDLGQNASSLHSSTPRIHLVYARYQRYAVRFKQNNEIKGKNLLFISSIGINVYKYKEAK